jgi:hypothetical protein
MDWHSLLLSACRPGPKLSGEVHRNSAASTSFADHSSPMSATPIKRQSSILSLLSHLQPPTCPALPWPISAHENRPIFRTIFVSEALTKKVNKQTSLSPHYYTQSQPSIHYFEALGSSNTMLKAKAQSVRKKRAYSYKIHTPPPDFKQRPGRHPTAPQRASLYACEQFARLKNINCTAEDLREITGIALRGQRRVWNLRQLRTLKNRPKETDSFPKSRGPKRVLTREDTKVMGVYLDREDLLIEERGAP